MYKWAILSNKIFWVIDKKLAHFVSLLTVTHIVQWPLANLGKYVTKSIQMLSHFHWGIFNCCDIPLSLWCSIFAFRHVKHDMKSTSYFIPVHQKDSFRSFYILVILGCMLKWLLGPSSRIILFNFDFVGTQTLFLKWRIPSPSSQSPWLT